jgi:hypothetical protein
MKIGPSAWLEFGILAAIVAALFFSRKAAASDGGTSLVPVAGLRG